MIAAEEMRKFVVFLVLEERQDLFFGGNVSISKEATATFHNEISDYHLGVAPLGAPPLFPISGGYNGAFASAA